MNTQGTDGGSVTVELPEGLHSTDFSMEDMRRKLIHKREKRYGADSPKGHACSNLVEQLQASVNYVRPAWAQDDRQSLPGLMNVQIERLERLSPKMLTYQPEGVA